MKNNDIKGWSSMNKPDILKLLTGKGLVADMSKKEIPSKAYVPNYGVAKFIKQNPKKVFIKDLETNNKT